MILHVTSKSLAASIFSTAWEVNSVLYIDSKHELATELNENYRHIQQTLANQEFSPEHGVSRLVRLPHYMGFGFMVHMKNVVPQEQINHVHNYIPYIDENEFPKPLADILTKIKIERIDFDVIDWTSDKQIKLNDAFFYFQALKQQ